jgi:hypothetical protein
MGGNSCSLCFALPAFAARFPAVQHFARRGEKSLQQGLVILRPSTCARAAQIGCTASTKPARWPLLAPRRALAVLAVLLSAPLPPAAAQAIPEPDVEDVLKTPLRNLNIDRRDIPPVLLEAMQNPYEAAGLKTCAAIIAEIAQLDAVLGADYDIAENKGTDRVSEGRIAQSVVGSFIPFRGILREVTGAASNERLLRTAYTAGMARRAFLKGLGLGRGCKYPARPKPQASSE